MAKIVFSAIGTTDPVRDEHDGGWLHCLRYVKPERTFIYLSAQMAEYEQKDHRYSRALELFNADLRLQGLPEIHMERPIVRPNMKNPHESGDLYSDLKEVLSTIHKKYPDDEIYINCSSGTPAMKNCLADMRMLLPFGDQLHFYQVSDPSKGHRKNDGRVRDDYDLITNWEFNEDRCSDPVWRIQQLAPDQHDKMFRAVYAKILIRQHEYHAARVLIEDDMKDSNGGAAVITALEGASLREMLYLHYAGVALNKVGIPCDNLQAEATKRVRQCAEMVMTMEQDINRKHFADMLRKITPVLYNLCIEYIYIHEKWDPTDYLLENGKADWGRIEKAKPKFSEVNNYPSEAFLSSKHLVPYIQKMEVGRDPCPSYFEKLRQIEMDVRNLAAHELLRINDEWIVKNTKDKKSSDDILKELKKLIQLIEPNYRNEFWNSYQRMDEAICSLLDEVEFPRHHAEEEN